MSQPIPKGCIYGKIAKGLYMYVDSFEQFKEDNDITRFTIHTLDVRRNPYAKIETSIVKKHSPLYKLIFGFIKYNDMFDAKTTNVLCMKRANVLPKEKLPQTKTGYMIKMWCQNRIDGKTLWTDYQCTLNREVGYWK